MTSLLSVLRRWWKETPPSIYAIKCGVLHRDLPASLELGETVVCARGEDDARRILRNELNRPARYHKITREQSCRWPVRELRQETDELRRSIELMRRNEKIMREQRKQRGW